MNCSFAMSKTIGGVLLLVGLLSFGNVSAQVVNTNSPYSRYGLGDRESIGYTKSQAMGGVAYALRDKNMINGVNPASFSSQDSLSFILDMAFRARYVIAQSEKDGEHTDPSASVHHVAIQFPVWRYFGVALGFQPFSQMGYNVTRFETDPLILSKIGNVRYHHHGNGGLSEAFLGFAFSPHRNISLGVSARYLFGSLNYAQDLYVPNHALYADVRYDDRLVLRGFGLTGGLQLSLPTNDDSQLRLGAVAELMPSLEAERRLEVKQVYIGSAYDIANNYFVGKERLSYPIKYGVGILHETPALSYGLDFSMQDWSNFSLRPSQQKNGLGYTLNAGVQWIPNPAELRYYLKRVQYRFGVYYSQLPMRIENTTLNEMGVTFGFGFPYRYSSSIFHTAFRLGMRGTTSNGLVRELHGEFVFGVSFNDIWFAKRKFQ